MGLPTKKANRLWSLLEHGVLRHPPSVRPTVQEALRSELELRTPLLRRALALKMRSYGIDPDLRSIDVDTDRLDDNDSYRISVPLLETVGDDVAHKIIDGAALAVAGVQQRVALMEALEALTGFRDEELRYFEAKLSALANSIDPSAQERSFDRVIHISGLPDLTDVGPGSVLSMGHVLALPTQPEWQAFRRWLRTASVETDAEIADRSRAVSESTSRAFHGTLGKTIRLLVTNGIGVAGLLPGIAASSADSFSSTA